MSQLALKLIVVAGGGALGAALRYSATLVTASWFKDQHYSTLLVNVIGALLIGYIINLLPQASSENELLRLALITGVLGGFTTFSAFSMESLLLIQTGEAAKAMLYIGATFITTLVAVFIGYEAGRMIHGI